MEAQPGRHLAFSSLVDQCLLGTPAWSLDAKPGAPRPVPCFFLLLCDSMCGRQRVALSRAQVVELAGAWGAGQRWVGQNAYHPFHNVAPGEAL